MVATTHWCVHWGTRGHFKVLWGCPRSLKGGDVSAVNSPFTFYLHLFFVIGSNRGRQLLRRKRAVHFSSKSECWARASHQLHLPCDLGFKTEGWHSSEFLANSVLPLHLLRASICSPSFLTRTHTQTPFVIHMCVFLSRSSCFPPRVTFSSSLYLWQMLLPFAAYDLSAHEFI